MPADRWRCCARMPDASHITLSVSTPLLISPGCQLPSATLCAIRRRHSATLPGQRCWLPLAATVAAFAAEAAATWLLPALWRQLADSYAAADIFAFFATATPGYAGCQPAAADAMLIRRAAMLSCLSLLSLRQLAAASASCLLPALSAMLMPA